MVAGEAWEMLTKGQRYEWKGARADELAKSGSSVAVLWVPERPPWLSAARAPIRSETARGCTAADADTEPEQSGVLARHPGGVVESPSVKTTIETSSRGDGRELDKEKGLRVAAKSKSKSSECARVFH